MPTIDELKARGFDGVLTIDPGVREPAHGVYMPFDTLSDFCHDDEAAPAVAAVAAAAATTTTTTSTSTAARRTKKELATESTVFRLTKREYKHVTRLKSQQKKRAKLQHDAASVYPTLFDKEGKNTPPMNTTSTDALGRFLAYMSERLRPAAADSGGGWQWPTNAGDDDATNGRPRFALLMEFYGLLYFILF